MLGLQEVGKAEVKASRERWDQAQEEMNASKEKNKAAIESLKQWCDEHTIADFRFLESREALRGGMQARFEKYSRLKDAIADAEAELERLRTCLDDAVQA